ncbi:MAG: 1,4-beta-xylanase [Ignavibacteria bacterium GWB2_36_8]|nr:MAG: 1,4-beta-xylanase [Ignavibacteria bacterium GWB2_36_8]OGU48635.1 MAG: 1,4-beta-xylanase [Ignavibacteria bacterium GWC2_36_12]
MRFDLFKTCFFSFTILSFTVVNTFPQVNPVLKDVFKDYFMIGAALNQAQSSGKDMFSVNLVKKHFNTVTPENILKWESVHPEPEKYNFEPADTFVDFGKKNNLFIVGHTLIWHNQTPKRVFEDEQGNPVDRETLLNRMRSHIHTVIGRYKGRINGWDVVNEALDEDGTLRQSQWLEIIGDDYLIKAFEFAHEADPDAELYYNDYSLENEPKRNGAIKLIKKLLAEGVKIDGVGLQGHYKMDWPTTSQLDSTIKAFAALGIKIMITELDVDVLPYDWQNHGADITLNIELQEKLNPYKNGLPDSVQQSLAKRYASLFDVLTNNNETVSRVTFWGVSDKDSWLNNWPVRGRMNYPLLFDRNGEPKPAFEAVIKEADKQNY